MKLADSTRELMQGLSVSKKSLVDAFVELLDTKTEILDKACGYIAGKISDKGLTKDFGKLTGDIKKTACIEYLIIGLSSGDIKEDEVNTLMK